MIVILPVRTPDAPEIHLAKSIAHGRVLRSKEQFPILSPGLALPKPVRTVQTAEKVIIAPVLPESGGSMPAALPGKPLSYKLFGK